MDTRPALALLAAALACVSLSACGGSSTRTTAGSLHLNTEKIALAIAASILQQRGLHATVLCPEHIQQRKGQIFTCTATTLSHGKPVKTSFRVVQTDNNGGVTYTAPK